MDGPSNIDQILEEVVTLPSLPATIAQITQMVNDPDCDLGQIGKAISADPAIALKALRLVNSAYYGLREKVTSVDQAVVLLGMKVIKNLVLTATILDTFQGGAQAQLQHSITCGFLMRIVANSGHAQRTAFDDPEEAFAYGLLHDVGKIIFEQFMPEQIKEVEEKCRRDGIPWYIAEQEVIGVDHAEMGAHLARRWKLPVELAEALNAHHELDRVPDRAFEMRAALVSVADYVCHASGFQGTGGGPKSLSPEVWEAAQLGSADMDAILVEFFGSLNEMGEFIRLAA